MPDGSRWATIAEAARAHRVRENTIRVWVTRGRVRAHTMLRRTYVCVDDLADAEREWTRRRAAKHQ